MVKDLSLKKDVTALDSNSLNNLLKNYMLLKVSLVLNQEHGMNWCLNYNVLMVVKPTIK